MSNFHVDNRVMAEYYAFSFIVGYLESAKEFSSKVDPSVLLQDIEEVVSEKLNLLNKQYPDTASK